MEHDQLMLLLKRLENLKDPKEIRRITVGVANKKWDVLQESAAPQEEQAIAESKLSIAK
ncbi:hypothetical protein [Ureibacillus terrenus]